MRRIKYGPHVKRTVYPLLAAVDWRKKAEKSVGNMSPLSLLADVPERGDGEVW